MDSIAPSILGVAGQVCHQRPAAWFTGKKANQQLSALRQRGQELRGRNPHTSLHHLDEAVGERNDLAKKERKKARELLQTLNKWVKETARK